MLLLTFAVDKRVSAWTALMTLGARAYGVSALAACAAAALSPRPTAPAVATAATQGATCWRRSVSPQHIPTCSF